ncbi:hypothetical protein MCEMAEM6B_02153 [Mycobacteriaceae bacterium]
MTDTITTWRDITGLTAEQAAQLAAGVHQTEEDLLEMAQTMAERNHLQTTLAHIAAPARAHRAGAWYDDGARITRTIYGTEAVLDTVTARVVGEQDSGGALTAWVEVIENRGHDGAGMTAGQARELAAALLDAADELDRLTGDAPPFQ